MGQGMLLPFSDFIGTVKEHNTSRNTEYLPFWLSPGTLTPFLVLGINLVVSWIKNKGTKLGLSSGADSETAEKEEYIYFLGIKGTFPLFFVSTQKVFYIWILSNLSFKT